MDCPWLAVFGVRCSDVRCSMRKMRVLLRSRANSVVGSLGTSPKTDHPEHGVAALSSPRVLFEMPPDSSGTPRLYSNSFLVGGAGWDVCPVFDCCQRFLPIEASRSWDPRRATELRVRLIPDVVLRRHRTKAVELGRNGKVEYRLACRPCPLPALLVSILL